jgi:hypothetical protein
MDLGFVPAAAVGGVKGVSVPLRPIAYCETPELPRFAT